MRDIRPVGDRACIIDLENLDQVLSLATQLRERSLAGVIEIVPAALTVLVTAVDRASIREVIREVQSIDVARTIETGHGRDVVIDTVYDGEDLAEVAALTASSVEAVVQAHTETVWQAAFGGFAPGFVYLAGGDPRFEVPRRSTPRTRVPAGSVALAGALSAVYPSDSPGGWQLIGRTELPMWDEGADPPARIQPGDRVRFRVARETVVGATAAPETAAAPEVAAAPRPAASPKPESEPAFVVERAGMQTLVQDDGRAGHAALGVTVSGALDRDALRRANVAVGNAADAAGLEVLNGGLTIRALRELTLAVTGAVTAIEIRAGDSDDRGAQGSNTEGSDAEGSDVLGNNSRVLQLDHAFDLSPGERLHVGVAQEGMRSYLAVRGGIAGTATLGSVAYDSISKLGTPPVQAGNAIYLAEEMAGGAGGDDAGAGADLGAASVDAQRDAYLGGHVTLRAVAGPRDDWFPAASIASFVRQNWSVTADSNRIGIRLQGAALSRSRESELPSEAVVSGSVQVPPSGQPLLFLADHPVTGGYPVIATVIDADLDRAAQLRPGDTINFVLVDADDVGDPHLNESPAPREQSVSFSIEIDGRRHAVRVAPEVATALEQLAADGNEHELSSVLAALAAAVES